MTEFSDMLIKLCARNFINISMVEIMRPGLEPLGSTLVKEIHV